MMMMISSYSCWMRANHNFCPFDILFPYLSILPFFHLQALNTAEGVTHRHAINMVSISFHIEVLRGEVPTDQRRLALRWCTLFCASVHV